MDIDRQTLLDGEELLLSKASNAVIKISDYGLKRLSYDRLKATLILLDRRSPRLPPYQQRQYTHQQHPHHSL